VAYGQVPAFMLAAVVGFLAIIGGGLIYVWRKGALKWV
jgi:NADH:ubiquinone oxidoreductase subunit 3 (subunit A)